ncbi:MAG TPA: hypothetical protein VFF39_09460 [Verrucomicrobiae bacterium]|nr:hypothetical protein [Verrucomicrobiae bacterium]
MKAKIIAAIAFLFITTNLTTQAQGPSPGPATGRAEGIYNEYASATGGKISFNVQTLSQGPLSDLAGRPFSAFLVAPTYRVESDEDGTELTNVGFIEPTGSDFVTQEMSLLPDQFQDVGLPLQMGVYRRLGITVSIGADSRSYESMEFCWASLSRCRLLDPVVVFLQSKVENRMRLIADGWGKQVTFTRASDLASGPSAAATSKCGFASNPSVTTLTETAPAHTVTHSGIIGGTTGIVVTKHLGQQSVTISCDSSCVPHVTVSSSPSTATHAPGWTTACANIGAKGTTGSQVKGIAQTKCTDSPPGGPTAVARVIVVDPGTAKVNTAWTTVGRVDPNGVILQDSCTTVSGTQ